MEREVRYVTTADGVRIAYAIQGEGVPFIWVPGWISHLDLDAGFLQMFGVDPNAEGVLWVQMDKRGSGLSGRNLVDYSLDTRVKDVIAVADDLGLATFALGGMSEGGPIALATAATHPDRVTKLVIHGSYANGESLAGSPDMRDGMLAVIRAEWGVGSNLLSDMFTNADSVLSGQQFSEYQKVAANHGDARRIIEAAVGIDVRPLLSKITAPTLVVHHRDDRVVPIDCGQEIAAAIKGARFLSFPGAHIASQENFSLAFSAIVKFVGGGTEAKRAASAADSTFRTVLFTDIVGHTAMMHRLGDEKGRGVLREHEQVTRNTLKTYGGSEVKTMGDGFMASFTSITKGVECAILRRAERLRGGTHHGPRRSERRRADPRGRRPLRRDRHSRRPHRSESGGCRDPRRQRRPRALLRQGLPLRRPRGVRRERVRGAGAGIRSEVAGVTTILILEFSRNHDTQTTKRI